MANIRAYKLAEELGIERNEFVDKAKTLGVDLKSAMAAIGEEEAAMLREKLGEKRRKDVTEARVERRGGSAVIRRRKRKAKPEPPPPPEPEPEPAPVEATPEEPAAPAPPVESPVVEEPPPVPEQVEPVEAPPVVAPPVEPQPPVATPEAPAPAVAASAAPEAPAAPAPGPAESGDRGRVAPADRKGTKRKQFKEVVNLREQEQIARQVTSRTTGRQQPVIANPRNFASQKRRGKKAAPAAAAAPKAQKRVVRVDGSISVAELAKQLGAKAADVQGRLMGLGTMVSVNQAIEASVAAEVAKQFGFEVQDVGFQEEAVLSQTTEETSEGQPRPPVVTVMGHVDHGKTTLLDALREANVVEGEAGGITQHIGAYQARLGSNVITFIDTPGHAAFTAMRARGAEVTDIVILVIAATDGIMPQTVEAIDHAKAAGVPIVVAVNKTDLPDANSQMARQRLMEHDLVPEEFGGDVQCIDISALKKTGLDALLEAVVLQSELLELTGDATLRAEGVVLEAQLDRGRGPVATVLVKTGTLHRGDTVVVGTVSGRVRSMLNEHGENLKEAGPSTPVRLVGLSAVPSAGEAFNVVESERVAKQIIAHREDERRATPEAAARPQVSLEDLFAQAEGDGPRELNVVVKADTQGSAEALRDSLLSIDSDKVNLSVIHSAVGAVTESDVQLAKASDAIVVGFHVRPDNAGRKAAEQMGVDVRTHQIIYEAIDSVRTAMAGLLPPNTEEKYLGRAEVKQTFTIPKTGTIAGSQVTDGLIRRSASCRLLRDGVQIYQGKFSSLKRFKDDAREVQNGLECGIGIEGYNDVKVGDVIEAFEVEEKAAEL